MLCNWFAAPRPSISGKSKTGYLAVNKYSSNKRNMKRFSFFLILISLISCVKDEDAEEILPWKQFTTDELNHTYYGKDTLTYTGSDISFHSQIRFLLNDSDIINVLTSTNFYPDVAVNGYQIIPIPPYASVQSIIHFDKKTGFDFVYTNLSNKVFTYAEDTTFYQNGVFHESYMSFSVGANGEFDFGRGLNNDQLLDFKLDTALVLNKLYNDVYKFNLPHDNLTGIKLIYYAKKYGYIKIEKLDGTKIELVNSDNI